MKRTKLNRGKAARRFNHASGRTKLINMTNRVMRGGIRL